MLVYRRRIYLLGLVVLFFLCDRLVKEWVQHQLTTGESIPVIKDVFHITFVHNTGAAFSLFQQYPAILLVLTSILFFGFLGYSLLKPILSLGDVYSLSLVLGGALGNIADRILLGKVVDYLDFTVINYPIFNLADVFIFSGISLLLLQYVRRKPTNHNTSSL